MTGALPVLGNFIVSVIVLDCAFTVIDAVEWRLSDAEALAEPWTGLLVVVDSVTVPFDIKDGLVLD